MSIEQTYEELKKRVMELEKANLKQKEVIESLKESKELLSIRIDLSNDMLDETCKSIHPTLIPGNYVKLIVNDTGCGMDKNTLDRIFEPYFTTKDIGKGTGIGVAVVHGIIERHKGSISAESEVDKGTTFTILFLAYKGRIEQEP